MSQSVEFATTRQPIVDCARQGLFKHAIEQKAGGNGNGFSDLVMAHQVFGKVCQDAGLILSINAHLWGALFPVLNYGSVQQKSTYIEKLICGELIAGHAISEIQAGSDINALEMSAENRADGFLLKGRKRYITNAAIADLMVVYARYNGNLSAFIVHRHDPGVTFCDGPRVTACQNGAMGDLIFNDCLLTKERLLGKAGAGNLMIQSALESERAFIFAGLHGVMQWQLETVIKHSRERLASGVHLGKHQAISHKIAEMKLRLDSIELWLKECARTKDARKRMGLVSAETKLFAAEAFLQSSLDAAQILGAGGMLEEQAMARTVNDALASRLFSGSSEIQKNIIASLLGTGDGYKGNRKT